MRLRPLSEAECYVRCYGARDDQVRVLRFDDRPQREAFVAGDDLRRWFEEPFDRRTEPEAA